MQRQALYSAIFGSSMVNLADNSKDFPRLTRQIVDASSAFAERVLYGGEQMLREAVISAHRTFRQYLQKLSGASMSWARSEALGPLAEASYRILRNPGVASVFGADAPPVAEWPYVEDANGAT